MEGLHQNILFEEKLLPCYLPGGENSFRKNILLVNGIRLVNVACVFLFALFVKTQVFNNHHGPVYVLCDILVPLAIIMMLYLGEGYYLRDGLSSRPISVSENGLAIPPVYFKRLVKDDGFIQKGSIEFIEIKWHKKFTATFSQYNGIIWYDAPVEFIVHLKNGKKIRSGLRPPETIREAVEIMKKIWGVRVERHGFGNGRMKRIVDRKVVEERDL